MTEAWKDTEQYLESFSRLKGDLSSGGRFWTGPIREEAIAQFAELGFPTTRQEAWRYTSVSPILREKFDLGAKPRPGALTPELYERLTFEKWDCTHVVFLNGRHAPELSMLGTLPPGVKLKNLRVALEEDRDLVEPHLGRYADFNSRPLTAINTAFLDQGAFLYVPRGTVVKEQIHLLYISTSNGGRTLSHPRNLIVVEEGAQVTLVESYAGFGGDVYFTNAVTELVAGNGAVVDHYKLQREGESAFHIGALAVHVGRDAVVSSQSISLGGGLVRQDVDVRLDGDGGDCTLNGLYVLAGRQHVDNHTVIDHARPHCSSRELYKGVLDDQSRGVFDGTIIVRQDAQKTDARQVNRNLLLSEQALADSKPTLQIHADDVKCTHAATIGQLDEEALFYLRSRALSTEMARSMLIHAFASDVVSRIKIDAVRVGLDCLLFTRLPRHHGPEVKS